MESPDENGESKTPQWGQDNLCDALTIFYGFSAKTSSEFSHSKQSNTEKVFI